MARLVSTRAEVHAPALSRCGVMTRCPLLTLTLAGLFVRVSISPVPKFAGPPGYEVPRVSCQFVELGSPDPLKSSRKSFYCRNAF